MQHVAAENHVDLAQPAEIVEQVEDAEGHHAPQTLVRAPLRAVLREVLLQRSLRQTALNLEW